MLSPALARWITETFDEVDAYSAQWLGLVHAKDPPIFEAARKAGAVVLTKDEDFANEVRRRGAPPVIWVRSGNAFSRDVLQDELPAALKAIRRGVSLVEIGTPSGPES
jgi:predicted nuclease of predicted toxin-antitoxin system